MKIYTKQGDAGQTMLFGGKHVTKGDVRIAAVGDVDELNAVMGLVVCAMGGVDGCDEVRDSLVRVQSELFDVGANLATPSEADRHHIPEITDSHVGRLEGEIDAAEGELEPLKTFILPGGSEAAARLHHARAVCRRAERSVVLLDALEPIERVLLRYLNRLADHLFVMARLINKRAGIDDVPWVPGEKQG